MLRDVVLIVGPLFVGFIGTKLNLGRSKLAVSVVKIKSSVYRTHKDSKVHESSLNVTQSSLIK